MSTVRELVREIKNEQRKGLRPYITCESKEEGQEMRYLIQRVCVQMNFCTEYCTETLSSCVLHILWFYVRCKTKCGAGGGNSCLRVGG